MKYQRIQDAKDLKGKRVLVRAGFNVPLVGKRVADGYRIDRIMPTVDYLKKKGAKIILISHIGRDPEDSIKPVANYFNRRKNIKVGYAPDLSSDTTRNMIENMQEGSVILLQNLRTHPGEVANDTLFAKHLASLADIYVNDAFSVSHRKHASIVGITKYLPSYAGLLFQDEIKHLNMALEPKHPFLFMLGGAKIETKMPLLKKFVELSDAVFVGGAIANDLFKARGIETGKSVTSSGVRGVGALTKNKKIVLPLDVLVDDGKNGVAHSLSNINKNDVIVDVGPQTRAMFQELVRGNKFVVVNGPIGWYEKGYEKGMKKLLKVLAESNAKVIIGGGDTVALVSKMKLRDSFHFISTGGGAMLDYLADGTLPAIEALEKNKRKYNN